VLLVGHAGPAGWECIVYHLGLALGGRPAASFAKRLILPVSNDTILRVGANSRAPRRPLVFLGGWLGRVLAERAGLCAYNLGRACPPPLDLGTAFTEAFASMRGGALGGEGAARTRELPECCGIVPIVQPIPVAPSARGPAPQ
jgi:hypothetical protein